MFEDCTSLVDCVKWIKKYKLTTDHLAWQKMWTFNVVIEERQNNRYKYEMMTVIDIRRRNRWPLIDCGNEEVERETHFAFGWYKVVLNIHWRNFSDPCANKFAFCAGFEWSCIDRETNAKDFFVVVTTGLMLARNSQTSWTRWKPVLTVFGSSPAVIHRY